MQQQTSEQKQLIESGQYFKDGLNWYMLTCESPISERAFLIVITCFSSLITFAAVLSFFLLLPISEVQTMVIKVSNAFNVVAHVHPLVSRPQDDPNIAVLRWSLRNYVEAREGYNIERQESLNRRVYATSEAQVYRVYLNLFKSDQSPTVIYQRHTVRNIRVVGVSFKGETAQVKFEASEEKSGQDPVKSTWVADISFRFTEIEVDQITGEITPMTFKVTEYKSKQIG